MGVFDGAAAPHSNARDEHGADDDHQLFFIVLTAAMLAFEWSNVDLKTSAMLLGVGILGGLAQYTYFEAMRRAPVSVLAPFEYTSLVWAFVLGFLIWGDIPASNVTLGAVLIGAAGLMILFSERLGRKAPASENG